MKVQFGRGSGSFWMLQNATQTFTSATVWEESVYVFQRLTIFFLWWERGKNLPLSKNYVRMQLNLLYNARYGTSLGTQSSVPFLLLSHATIHQKKKIKMLKLSFYGLSKKKFRIFNICHCAIASIVHSVELALRLTTKTKYFVIN